jgi:hypothetical protein
MKKSYLLACSVLLLAASCNKKNLGGPDYNGLTGYYKVNMHTMAANSATRPYYNYLRDTDTLVKVYLDVAIAVISVPVDTFGGYQRIDTLMADAGTPDTLLSYHERPAANNKSNYTMRLTVDTRTGGLQYSYAEERSGYYWRDVLTGIQSRLPQ